MMKLNLSTEKKFFWWSNLKHVLCEGKVCVVAPWNIHAAMDELHAIYDAIRLYDSVGKYSDLTLAEWIEKLNI